MGLDDGREPARIEGLIVMPKGVVVGHQWKPQYLQRGRRTFVRQAGGKTPRAGDEILNAAQREKVRGGGQRLEGFPPPAGAALRKPASFGIPANDFPRSSLNTMANPD